MNFEHYHQYFKRIALACKNFIHVTYTLAWKHQLFQAYQSSANLFPFEAEDMEAFPFVPDCYGEDLKHFISTCHFSSEALMDVTSVKIEDIEFKKNIWMLLGQSSQPNHLDIGLIETIIKDDDKFYLILSKHPAKLMKKLGIYKIKSSSEYCMVETKDLEIACPQPVYSFGKKLCFSVKYIPLAKN